MYLSKLQSDGYVPRAGHGISGRGAMALVPYGAEQESSDHSAVIEQGESIDSQRFSLKPLS